VNLGGDGEMQQKLQGFRPAGVRSDGVHGIRARYLHMIRRAFISMIAIVAAAGLAATPASAQRGRDRDHGLENPFQRGDNFSQWDRPREERAPQREVSLGEVLRDLRGKYGGQHLDARRVGDYYMIAWMTRYGRRLNMRVNVYPGREE